MLSLDSPRWDALEHAYGRAGNIPALLKQLESLPSSEGESEPWFSLWSSLCHQGDVYTASFAAVPHVIACLQRAPGKAGFSYFQFPAWVEICRQAKGVEIPKDLVEPYFSALKKLPRLVAEAADQEWDAGFLACALSAIAAAKGFGTIAEAVQELNPEIAREFLEWHYNQ